MNNDNKAKSVVTEVTIVLDKVSLIDKFNKSVIYVSGEEGKEQIRLRAKRLNLDESSVKLATATDVRNILSKNNHNYL